LPGQSAYGFVSACLSDVLVAKVVIVDKTLSAAEIVGAGLALAAWLTLAVSVGARFRVTFVALLFSASVIAERLAPFEFTAQPGNSAGFHFSALYTAPSKSVSCPF
jgi:hypothetical protein